MAQLNDTMVQGDLRTTGTIYGTFTAVNVDNANLAIPMLTLGDNVGSTGDFFIGSGSGKNLPNTTDNFNIHTTVTHFTGTTYRLTQIATPTASTQPTGIYERCGISSNGTSWTFGSWMGVSSSSHSHGNIANGGTLTDTAAAAAGNDYVVIRDADNNKVQTSTIKGTDVADAVSKKHSHSTLTLSTTAQTYDGSHTLALPSTIEYKNDSDGKWVGVGKGTGTSVELCYWKVCSFTITAWWSLQFEMDVTNGWFDSNTYETKIVKIGGTSSGTSVDFAEEIREYHGELNTSRGYGNILYYTISGTTVTIYIKSARGNNVTQFARLNKIMNQNSLTSDITWYCDTTAPSPQPSSPTKFTEVIGTCSVSELAAKQDVSNLVQSIRTSDSAESDKYPSELAVRGSLDSLNRSVSPHVEAIFNVAQTTTYSHVGLFRNATDEPFAYPRSGGTDGNLAGGSEAILFYASENWNPMAWGCRDFYIYVSGATSVVNFQIGNIINANLPFPIRVRLRFINTMSSGFDIRFCNTCSGAGPTYSSGLDYYGPYPKPNNVEYVIVNVPAKQSVSVDLYVSKSSLLARAVYINYSQNWA